MEVVKIEVKDKPMFCNLCRFVLSLENEKYQCMLKEYGQDKAKFDKDTLYKFCPMKETKNNDN